jgi:hypothetical protein
LLATRAFSTQSSFPRVGENTMHYISVPEMERKIAINRANNTISHPAGISPVRGSIAYPIHGKYALMYESDKTHCKEGTLYVLRRRPDKTQHLEMNTVDSTNLLMCGVGRFIAYVS